MGLGFFICREYVKSAFSFFFVFNEVAEVGKKEVSTFKY